MSKGTIALLGVWVQATNIGVVPTLVERFAGVDALTWFPRAVFILGLLVSGMMVFEGVRRDD